MFEDEGRTCVLTHHKFGTLRCVVAEARITDFGKSRGILDGHEGIVPQGAGDVVWTVRGSQGCEKEEEGGMPLHATGGLAAPQIRLAAEAAGGKTLLYTVVLGPWLSCKLETEGEDDVEVTIGVSFGGLTDGPLHALGLQRCSFTSASEGGTKQHVQKEEKLPFVMAPGKKLDRRYEVPRSRLNICDEKNAVIYKWTSRGEAGEGAPGELQIEADSASARVTARGIAGRGAPFELSLQPKY